VATLHEIRRDLLGLRRAIWPLREVVNALLRDDLAVVKPETRLFLRDAYDHTVQIIDVVETQRELAAGLMDMYLSILSHRMNEVMKVLTIIATIFIPLTFVAGVYGMNFEVMPELGWRWGYPASLAVMALTAGALLVYFRRKGWIGKAAPLAEGEGGNGLGPGSAPSVAAPPPPPASPGTWPRPRVPPASAPD
jgi:magnesium transporter